jgi:hypothetical protein
MLWPHPSQRRLARWARDIDDPRVQLHVEACDRCLAIVERVERLADVPIGDVLRAMLQAPETLEEELVVRAEAARTKRASLEILGGLAAVPWETLRLMMDEGRSGDG